VLVGVLLALATALLWGSREILLRSAFETTQPVQGLFVTVAATFLISLVAAFFFSESTLWNRLTLGDVVLWATVGMLQFPVAMTLYYLGIRSVGASRSSVVSSVAAIATPLLGMTLLGEPSTLTVIAGVFVAGAGIFTVSASDIGSDEWTWQKGMTYALLAGLIWSMANVLARFGFTGQMLPMTAVAITAGAPLVPIVLYLISRGGGKDVFSAMKHSPQLVSGCLLSALGQVTLFAALSFASTVYVVPTYSTKSLVTVILAYGIMPKSEKINKRVVIGAIFAISGIVLINL